MIDLAIIGGGPAGLSAGIYASRGGLENVHLYEKVTFGGQIILSSEVENYPGLKDPISGLEVMKDWLGQAKKFGLKEISEEVVRISKSGGIFDIELASKEIKKAKSVLVCTGSVPRKAGFKGEDEFFGKGVSVCATCDGFFYKNRDVIAVGGGDTALEEALYLSSMCSKVYLVHRRDKFRAAPITVSKVLRNKKIELVIDSTVDEIYGDKNGVEGAIIQNKKDKSKRNIKAFGVFIFVGVKVNNSVLKQADGSFLCDLNDNGEVIVDINMHTSLDGLFSAGDMRINSPKQVVCSASDGAIAGIEAISYVGI